MDFSVFLHCLGILSKGSRPALIKIGTCLSPSPRLLLTFRDVEVPSPERTCLHSSEALNLSGGDKGLICLPAHAGGYLALAVSFFGQLGHGDQSQGAILTVLLL